MRAVVLALAVGCSFRSGTALAPTTGSGSDAGPVDASDASDAAMIDAAIDAAIDAPPDARPIDAPRDAFVCPNTYATIAGAPPTKKYRIFNFSSTAASDQSQPWATAVSTCMADGAHLAFPANSGEMTALINAITTDTNGPYFWLGITDAATEGTWLTVLGGAVPYLVWDAGQPNGGTAQNCAAGYETNADMFDYLCGQAYPFACECD